MSEVITPSISLPFEGETTFNSQSELARDYLEQAVGNTPSIVQNADIKAALTSLQDLVTIQGQKTVKSAQSMPSFAHALVDIDPAELERPPWDVVEEVLEKASSVSLPPPCMILLNEPRFSHFVLLSRLSFFGIATSESNFQGNF